MCIRDRYNADLFSGTPEGGVYDVYEDIKANFDELHKVTGAVSYTHLTLPTSDLV